MAYQFVNVDKLDLNPSIGVGIKVPFDGPTGINTLYTTQETIKSNLINYLLTNQKERPFNPTFGAGLSGILFEPLTEETVDTVKEIIVNGISDEFEKIQILDLTVGASDADQTLKIYLKYTITNTSIEDELLISYGTVESVGENNVMNVIEGRGDTFNTNRIL